MLQRMNFEASDTVILRSFFGTETELDLVERYSVNVIRLPF